MFRPFVFSISLLRALAFASIALSATSWAVAADPAISVMPAAPRYQEPVYLRITPPPNSGMNFYGAQVSMTGTTITVRYQWIPEIGGYPYDVMLGRFPAGTYRVELNDFSGVVASLQFAVGAPEVSASFPGHVPPVNYTDLWWNPAESGWGMSITQGPTNEVFAVMYVHDANGNPTWYTLEPGEWVQTNIYSIYSGPVYRTTGPYFRGAFDPNQVRQAAVGTWTISFRDFAHGELRYTIDGVSGVKQLERMPIE